VPDHDRERGRRRFGRVRLIAEDPLSLRRPNTFEVMRQLAERDGLMQNGDW
jgi:hypothetical protein